MPIGLVADSAGTFLAANATTILPITVRIGEAVVADHRDATRKCLHAHVEFTSWGPRLACSR